MKQSIYKYDIGDLVQFKDEYSPTASLDLSKLVGTRAVIADRRDYNGPCYQLVGLEDCGYFKEHVFVDIYSHYPFVIFAGDTTDTLQPIASANTEELAIEKAKYLRGAHRCIEAVYTPDDNINEVVYSYYF